MCCDNASYLFFLSFSLIISLLLIILIIFISTILTLPHCPKAFQYNVLLVSPSRESISSQRSPIFYFLTLYFILITHLLVVLYSFKKKLAQCSDHLKQSSDSVQSLSSPNSIFCKNAKIYPKTYRISRDLE